MTSQMNPRTAATNGRLWGARARDWADLQEGMVRPVYEAVLRRTRIKAGSHYLDVGCGTGMAAQMASALGARAVGIDASEALLTIARERTPSGHFRIGDLEALPLTDQSFDVVTGFNSFQYAGNPGVALAEARPFALSDETALRKFAEDARLRPVEVFDVASPFHYPDLDTEIRALNSAAVAVRATENSSEEAVSQAYRDALMPFRGAEGLVTSQQLSAA